MCSLLPYGTGIYHYALYKKCTVSVHSLYFLNLVLKNWMEWSMIPACPSLMCSLNIHNVNGTNSENDFGLFDSSSWHSVQAFLKLYFRVESLILQICQQAITGVLFCLFLEKWSSWDRDRIPTAAYTVYCWNFALKRKYIIYICGFWLTDDLELVRPQEPGSPNLKKSRSLGGSLKKLFKRGRKSRSRARDGDTSRESSLSRGSGRNAASREGSLNRQSAQNRASSVSWWSGRCSSGVAYLLVRWWARRRCPLRSPFYSSLFSDGC